LEVVLPSLPFGPYLQYRSEIKSVKEKTGEEETAHEKLRHCSLRKTTYNQRNRFSFTRKKPALEESEEWYSAVLWGYRSVAGTVPVSDGCWESIGI